MSPYRLCFALGGSLSSVWKDQRPYFSFSSTVATAAAPRPPALHGGAVAHGRAAAGVTAAPLGAPDAAPSGNCGAPPLADSPLSSAARGRAVLTAAVQLAGLLYLVAAITALLSPRHTVVAFLGRLDPHCTGVAATAVAAAAAANAASAVAARGGATVTTPSAAATTENSTTAVATAVAAAAAALGYTPLPPRCTLTPAVLRSSVYSRFFVAHAAGWAAKAVAIRQRRLLWVASWAWEVVEASLSGVLPNFAECWWDAVVLDVGLANAVGMEVGLAAAAAVGAVPMVWTRCLPEREKGTGERAAVVHLLSPKRRWWRQQRLSPRRRGGSRCRRQLVWSWGRFGWHPQSICPWAGEKLHSECQLLVGGSTRRCLLGATGVVVVLTWADLNAFTLKAALDVPVASPLNVARLAVVAALGIPAAAEYYTWIGRRCSQGWVASAATATAGPVEEVVCPHSGGRVGCALTLMAVLGVEVAVAVKFWDGRFAERAGATAIPWGARAGWAVAALACVVWLRRRWRVGCG